VMKNILQDNIYKVIKKNLFLGKKNKICKDKEKNIYLLRKNNREETLDGKICRNNYKIGF